VKRNIGPYFKLKVYSVSAVALNQHRLIAEVTLYLKKRLEYKLTEQKVVLISAGIGVQPCLSLIIKCKDVVHTGHVGLNSACRGVALGEGSGVLLGTGISFTLPPQPDRRASININVHITLR
jgi:hypothetical protein